MSTTTLVLLLLAAGGLLLTIVILATRQPTPQKSGLDGLTGLVTAVAAL